VIHYHGTPITPRGALGQLPGRCFCVSYARPEQVTTCHQLGQSILLDNGAYTSWTQRKPTDWPGYCYRRSQVHPFVPLERAPSAGCESPVRVNQFSSF
jgi:hypothetical protein